MATPPLQNVVLHKKRQVLALDYTLDTAAETYELSAEFLRVHSPSAEVRGHGGEAKKLPLNKSGVAIIALEPQGNYALKLVFNDGHDSGIYTWDYLYELARNREEYWQRYLEEADIEQRKQHGEAVVQWIK